MINKSILTALVISFCTISFSQKNVKSQNLTSNVKILVQKINETREQFDTILSKNNWLTTSYNISKNEFNVSIKFQDSLKYINLLKTVKTWGILIDENTSSNNSISDESKNYLFIESLRRQREQFEFLASKVDSTSVKYFEYWEKIIELDKTISINEINYNLNSDNSKVYILNIRFFEEELIGSDYNESWINMPGVEYSYLFTEQPLAGMSSNYMVGYHLKYMFNYRKSYLSIGLYKSSNVKSKTEINEIYTFAVGQDFYSRKLGRGKRKFFNLYTSFNAGVLMASSESNRYNSWFANPYFGVELFKNKHILIDNKIGYFLPFENNRNQRGLLYNVSFNFVF
jgi:hypothetical protein